MGRIAICSNKTIPGLCECGVSLYKDKRLTRNSYCVGFLSRIIIEQICIQEFTEESSENKEGTYMKISAF